HWALYALLLLVPVLGWLAISYYGPFAPFGLPLPVLVAANDVQATRFFALHRYAAYAMILVVALHAGAALLHFLVLRDGVMARMPPGAGRWPETVRGAHCLAAARAVPAAAARRGSRPRMSVWPTSAPVRRWARHGASRAAPSRPVAAAAAAQPATSS